MGDQYYVDEYGEEPDMDELEDYMSPDEGDGDLAGFERPEMKVDFSTAVVVSNLPKVRDGLLICVAMREGLPTARVFVQMCTVALQQLQTRAF